MQLRKAYRYLKKYGGLDYLYENRWALHTDNPFWAARDMQVFGKGAKFSLLERFFLKICPSLRDKWRNKVLKS
ncbi:MAG: DUF3791 domain-containing protein [Prevotellaceae bacterium]|jgi:hypothetical protein|nr:DUF3791 domain-containing protein [Prevotellaceae bacterium]